MFVRASIKKYATLLLILVEDKYETCDYCVRIQLHIQHVLNSNGEWVMGYPL
jgi:hypothetical protein